MIGCNRASANVSAMVRVRVNPNDGYYVVWSKLRTMDELVMVLFQALNSISWNTLQGPRPDHDDPCYKVWRQETQIIKMNGFLPLNRQQLVDRVDPVLRPYIYVNYLTVGSYEALSSPRSGFNSPIVATRGLHEPVLVPSLEMRRVASGSASGMKLGPESKYSEGWSAVVTPNGSSQKRGKTVARGSS